MIGSVVKAIGILRVLSDADGCAVSLGEISALTGYHKSTCVHILETLISENMAERVSRSEGYVIGYGAFMLSRFGGFNHRLKTVTHPILKWLTAKTGQTSIFCVLKGNKRICIDFVSGEWSIGAEKIRVENLPKASTGMVLIANLSDVSQREFFIKYREIADEMECDPDKLKQRLEEIKRQGYGENYSLLDGGIEMRGFAVPVFRDEECVGAIGLPYYGERREAYLKYLKAAATETMRRLRFFDGTGDGSDAGCPSD